MKKLILLSALLLTSCSTSCELIPSRGEGRGTEIGDATELVVNRHDTFVLSDDSLTQEQRDEFVAESAEMLSIGTSETFRIVDFAVYSIPVCNRHNDYVEAQWEDPFKTEFTNTSNVILKYSGVDVEIEGL